MVQTTATTTIDDAHSAKGWPQHHRPIATRRCRMQDGTRLRPRWRLRIRCMRVLDHLRWAKLYQAQPGAGTDRGRAAPRVVCGSVALDDATGVYHMYYSHMANHCPLSAWQHNSEVWHATSTTPEGPYTPHDRVMAAFAHNPTVRRAPDGTWLIYHIGGGPRPPMQNCTSPGPARILTSIAQARRLQSGVGATNVAPIVSYASSPNGPWKQLHVAGLTNEEFNNPAPEYCPTARL